MAQGPRNRFYCCLCRILMIHIGRFFCPRKHFYVDKIQRIFDMKSQQHQIDNVLIICRLAQFVMHI